MKKQVYAYLHTHWDREWYRDKEDFNVRFLKVFDIVLDELKSGNAPFFYLDGQVVALLDYLKYRKERLQEILYFIKNKNLAIGPYFASADSYLVNFCSMLKNLDIGMKISSDFYQKEFIGYMSDIFGVSKSAFRALNLKNIDKALIWRGVNPVLIKNNCNFIKDNIKTTWLVQGYFNDFIHNNNVEGLSKYLDKISKYSPSCLLLPIGADHLGMLQNANDKINDINKKLENYEIILSSPFEYFSKVDYENKKAPEEFLDNSNTYILNGVYSARVYQKIKNAKIQNKLSRIAEPLDFYLGQKYQKNIEFAYKTLIKNHAHDGIYGCSTDSVHRALDARFEKCDNLLSSIINNIKGDFKKEHGINGAIKNKAGLFNLSNKNNIKVIKIITPYKIENAQILDKKRAFEDSLLYDIYSIPVTEDIKTLYLQAVEISSNQRMSFNTVKIKKPEKNVKITLKSIENNKIKLEIKNKKIYITNFKQTFELKFTDIADEGDSYNFSPKGKYKKIDILKTEIEYDGQIQSCLKIYFSGFVLRVILDNHCEFLKFTAEIKNRKKNHKLQAVLLLNNNISKTISDDAWGIIERKIDYNYNVQNFMPVKRPYELKTNIYPMQNFVCANDAIIMTKGLNEYEIYKNELRVCLLRAIGTISNPKNKVRAIPAGPDLECLEAQCIRDVETDFAVAFGNYKKAYNLLDEFYENYIALEGQYAKEINIKFDEIPNNTFLYGINKGEKILYDFMKNK